jgi:hypothetical protein
VGRAGAYKADFRYTSNRGGTISIDVNGNDATGRLQNASTDQDFEIRYHGKAVTTSLKAGAVGTYVW